MARRSLVRPSFSLAAVVLSLALGCGPGGPRTVPVNGSLTIDGQPANNVTISLVPNDSTKETASGAVKDGKFELFTGLQGIKGAVPGKYKVVLASRTEENTRESGKAYMGGGAGGRASAPPKPELSFPEKYLTAANSDKEVEITSGENNLTIEIASK